jgi:hypothetical protein
MKWQELKKVEDLLAEWSQNITTPAYIVDYRILKRLSRCCVTGPADGRRAAVV